MSHMTAPSLLIEDRREKHLTPSWGTRVNYSRPYIPSLALIIQIYTLLALIIRINTIVGTRIPAKKINGQTKDNQRPKNGCCRKAAMENRKSRSETYFFYEAHERRTKELLLLSFCKFYYKMRINGAKTLEAIFGVTCVNQMLFMTCASA